MSKAAGAVRSPNTEHLGHYTTQDWLSGGGNMRERKATERRAVQFGGCKGVKRGSRPRRSDRVT